MWGQELCRKVENKGLTENSDSIKNSFVWIRHCSTRCWVSSAFFVKSSRPTCFWRPHEPRQRICDLESAEFEYLLPFWSIYSACVCMCMLSRVWLFVTPLTVANQAPLSMAFPRQYWSVLLFPPPGDFSNPGIQPVSLASSVLAGGFFTIVPSRKTHLFCILYIYSF